MNNTTTTLISCMTNCTAPNTNVSGTITTEEEWFTITFLSLVIVVTIVGNSIALHAFIISPELKKATYYFIATLCISDLMIAMFSIPFWVYVTANFEQYSNNEIPSEFMLFISILDIFCATWSITSLAMISIERYICILYALRYYYIMTNRRVVYMLVFIMFYASTTTIINYVQGDAKESTVKFIVIQALIIFLAYVLPVMVKLFTYSRIFKVARKQAAEIQKYSFNLASRDSEDQTENRGSLIDPRDTMSSREHKDSSSNSNRTSHSNSCVSWTTSSPLLGRKTIDSKKASGKLNHQQSEGEDYSFSFKRQNTTTSSKSLKRKLRGCFKGMDCFHGDSNESLDHNKNKSSTDNTIEQSVYIDECTNTLQRNDTEKSIKSISRISETDSHYRDSLDVGAEKEMKLQNGTSLPIIQRLRASANWSPSNSPLLFRKSNSSSNSSSKNKRQEQRVRRFKKELRATKVVGLIIGTFLLCWTPFMILMTLLLAKVTVSRRAVLIAKNLHYLNSAINPVLYVVLNKVYRRAVHKSLNKIKNKLCCS